MPDCAYVTLDVSAADAVRTADILTQHGATPSTEYDDPDGRQFTFDEAPWGASYLTDMASHGTDITKILREAGIAYTIRDGGHYTWDPYEIAWRPGMAEDVQRDNGQESQTMLQAGTYQLARDRLADPAALVEWLDGYFSEDPTRWTLPPETPTRGYYVTDTGTGEILAGPFPTVDEATAAMIETGHTYPRDDVGGIPLAVLAPEKETTTA